MHILLAGASGFFGKSLVEYFIHNNHTFESRDPRLTLISRSPSASLKQYANNPRIRALKADIMDLTSLPFHDQFSHVIHAAFDSSLAHSMTPRQIYESTVMGTQNMLQLANNCPNTRFLFISSGAVYGPDILSKGHVSESIFPCIDITLSQNTYAFAKYVAEYNCLMYHELNGLIPLIARCFSFVGPAMPRKSHYAIENFISDAKNSRPILISGNGLAIRSYMYQSELARWLFTILFHSPACEIFNVGSDIPISLKSLAVLIRELSNSKFPIIIKNNHPSLNSNNIYLPSISKASSLLGLTNRIDLETSIQHTLNSYD